MAPAHPRSLGYGQGRCSPGGRNSCSASLCRRGLDKAEPVCMLVMKMAKAAAVCCCALGMCVEACCNNTVALTPTI